MSPWRVVASRPRMGKEKRGRAVVLAVSANDLQGAFEDARGFMAQPQYGDGWRIIEAKQTESVFVLEGQGDLLPQEPQEYAQAGE